jgi:cytochrome c peroxidase
MCRASVLVLLAGLLVLTGCQPARPYDPASPAPRNVSRNQPDEDPALDADIRWMDAGPESLHEKDVRIEFVHPDRKPELWSKLPGYWTDTSVTRVAGLVGMPGLPGAALAADKAPPVVRVKLPLGLPDPTSFLPDANPPTREKWKLGRQLFFDPTWLTSNKKQSCATCHQPDRDFSNDDKTTQGRNVPSLVNCLYNFRQFWDGRAQYLEEVVQRQLDDEREPREPGPFRHVWHGVVGRLRERRSYRDRFEQVFGTPPTQDAVGKALATYLRTLLAGNSIYDRARQAKGPNGDLHPKHFEAVLDESALKQLGRVKEAKGRVARRLHNGYDLFLVRGSCAACHWPYSGLFSDGKFHNIGVGIDDPGRFAVAPFGELNRNAKAAFRTPTLRNLTRTAPYFHNGHTSDLAVAVTLHVKPPRKGPLNLYLDPLLAAGPEGAHRDFGLSEQDIADLVLFLQALDGDEVDRSVRTPESP